MNAADKDSVRSVEGSYTDSGRGPSEEGEHLRKVSSCLPTPPASAATALATPPPPKAATTTTSRASPDAAGWWRHRPPPQQYRHVPGSNCGYTTPGSAPAASAKTLPHSSRVRSLTLPPQPISFQPRKGILREGGGVGGPPNGVSRDASAAGAAPVLATSSLSSSSSSFCLGMHSLGKTGSVSRRWIGGCHGSGGHHGNAGSFCAGATLRRGVPALSTLDSDVIGDDRSTVIV